MKARRLTAVAFGPGGVGRPNPEEAVIEELRKDYDGKLVTGHDLDVF